jgi:hypothetical protein
MATEAERNANPLDRPPSERAAVADARTAAGEPEFSPELREQLAERKVDAEEMAAHERRVAEAKGEVVDETAKLRREAAGQRQMYSYEKPVFLPELADDDADVWIGSLHDHPGWIMPGVAVELTAEQDRRIRQAMADRHPHQFLSPDDERVSGLDRELNKTRAESRKRPAKRATKKA